MSLPTGDVKNSPSDADLYEIGAGDLFETNLAADITETSPGVGEVLQLSSTTNLPTNGFLLVKTTNELIRYEGISSSPVGVIVKERGFGSTSATAASSGDTVWLVDASYYHDLLAAYIQRLMSEHNADGSHGDMTVTGNITQSDGKYIATDEIRARDADGLKLYDDGGNGIFVQDGGNVGIKRIPDFALDVDGPARINYYIRFVGDDQAGFYSVDDSHIINIGGGSDFLSGAGIVLVGDSRAINPGRLVLRSGGDGANTNANIDFEYRDTSGIKSLARISSNGYMLLGDGNPDCQFHIDTETTTATEVIFQIESDVTTADTVKFRVEADGEAFSDIGFTTFSPILATDPDKALDQALADAKKAHKPYKGLFPFANLTELASKKNEVQSRIEELAQHIKDTESEITQLENDIAKEPDSERKTEMAKRLAALQEALETHKQDKQRYIKRLAAINHWEQVAKQHGLKGRADEKERWGRDPTKIAMGVALWAEAARQKIAELEAKVAQLEAKLAMQGA